ncbi:ATP-binding protein [Caldimonas brevitalea]|uniref:histidine kinase n=1 Tax=Caldimonas brevitalea TaxID=413882 RepID=A0A0G3BMR9_9BURK|nr:ATP-binding protein [Caldimonas brevitalea]AKJ27810.1 C4-dicarboxylate transport sensor protein DctB [Caldimonas brevitalea]
MAEQHEPYLFLEDRPTLWPHTPAERTLPADIERRLQQSHESVFADRDRASSLVEEAVLLARAGGDPSVLARTLYRGASVMHHLRRPDRAYVLCLEAQPMLERLDDRWRATKVLMLRGRCCLAVNEHERARTLLTEAALRFESMDNRTELARSYNLLALAHCLAGELEQAVRSAERAVVTLPSSENPLLEIRLRHNQAFFHYQLGRQQADLGNPAAAREEYARAAAALPDIHTFDVGRWDPAGADVLGTIASVAMINGDARTTRLALAKLATWARRWDSPMERGLAWLRFAEFRDRLGRQGSSIACARRAVAYLTGVPMESNLPAALRLLADLLEQVGDLQGAYEAYREATRVESEQQREAISLRAALLSLDLEAEQELRRSEQTLAYAQRLSNVGHLVAGVNHELNQPMASIRLLAEMTIELIERGEHEEVRRSIESMLKLSTHLRDLTFKLAAFPVPSACHPEPVDLASAVSEAMGNLRSRLTQTPCEIVVELPPLSVRAQEGRLVRVIANLLNNALDVLEGRAHRRISVSCTASDTDVTLTVVDSGPGLSEPVLERLFQPFFSTKTAGRGLGLGLALSRDAVREMGGELTARNAPHGGAVFEIRLPRHHAGAKGPGATG